MTDLAQAHDDLRPLMFSIAYRMLGSVAEAEDVVQDAFLKMHRAIEDGERLDSPDEYATTVTTRLAIDTLRSARVRREEYVGPWLPEPLVPDRSPDPATRFELDDSVSVAMLVLMESLTPVERAVFLLREALGIHGARTRIPSNTDSRSSASRRRPAVSTSRGPTSASPQAGGSRRRSGDATSSPPPSSQP